MSLKVIGSGFGRTGTMSTKIALEQLGLGPCHHMVEVLQKPELSAKWTALAKGAEPDWECLFAGYNVQVDWPGARVWEQTAQAFPDAKVLHNERPEDDWWKSFSTTIAKMFQRRGDIDMPPHIAAQMDAFESWVFEDFPEYGNRDAAIAAYRRNNEKVRDLIPADRLLVFNVREGWAPLCAFLDMPVPATPFPRSNPRDEFWVHFGGEPA